MNVLRCAVFCLLIVLNALAGRCEASVVIHGTRVVYPDQEKEVTVKLSNESDSAALVQVWLDAGNERSTPETVKVPFVVVPPIFRMDPHKDQAVRLMYTHEPLPTDKESVFWVNVLEIPPKAKTRATQGDVPNHLQFAFRTRIKLFFRPAGLTDVAAAPAKLHWELISAPSGKGVALQVTNPTPYYVSFSKVGLKVGDQSLGEEQGGGMVAPGSSAVLPLKDVASRPVGSVQAQFTVISDFGALDTRLAPLIP